MSGFGGAADSPITKKPTGPSTGGSGGVNPDNGSGSGSSGGGFSQPSSGIPRPGAFGGAAR